MSGAAWKWGVMAMSLTLVAGASVGVVVDRVAFKEDAEPPAVSSSHSGTIWFDCDQPAKDEEAASERGADWRSRRLESLRDELGLDEPQVQAVREVVEHHRVNAHGFWDRTRGEYCGMRDSLRNDVRSLLRPDQLDRFERRLQRVDERERARMMGGEGHRREREGAKQR